MLQRRGYDEDIGLPPSWLETMDAFFRWREKHETLIQIALGRLSPPSDNVRRAEMVSTRAFTWFADL
jgi:hypothetical protein